MFGIAFGGVCCTAVAVEVVAASAVDGCDD